MCVLEDRHAAAQQFVNEFKAAGDADDDVGLKTSTMAMIDMLKTVSAGVEDLSLAFPMAEWLFDMREVVATDFNIMDAIAVSIDTRMELAAATACVQEKRLPTNVEKLDGNIAKLVVTKHLVDGKSRTRLMDFMDSMCRWSK